MGERRVPIAVVGAGVSGLAAAHRCVELRPEIEVLVLEAEARAGGLIKTEVRHVEGTGDFVIEQGPDAIIRDKPAAIDLAQRLDLGSDVLPTNTRDRGAFVVHRGMLEPIPEGFSMMAPARILPMLRTPILSARGKLRLLSELVRPRRRTSTDESAASFVERRAGREVLERLAQPLMGGIYGASLDELSIEAALPRFPQLESEYRSVTLGLMKQLHEPPDSSKGGAAPSEASLNDPKAAVRYALFFSFKRGMQTLTDALASKLGSRILFQHQVLGVESQPDAFRLRLASGESIVTEQVIFACSPAVTSELLANMDRTLSGELASIPLGSTATAAYAWPRSAIPHALNGFGFVVPTIEKRNIIASTWASKKFAGRAPEGYALIRVFFGGEAQTELLSRSEAELCELGRRELAALIGVTRPPLFVAFSRQTRAMPKYIVGHRERVQRIEARVNALFGIHIAGNALYGVGIPDAIAAGERAAERALATSRAAARI
jgi:oxygen-dependent protoporphyrinogen oxidase